jgi:hypothetical protein
VLQDLITMAGPRGRYVATSSLARQQQLLTAAAAHFGSCARCSPILAEARRQREQAQIVALQLMQAQLAERDAELASSRA